MTQFLPPNLLALFAPREPLVYLPPVGKLRHEKETQPYSGIATFILQFEDPKDTPPPTRVETREEKKERKRKERAEQVAYKLEQDLALWDPTNDVNIYGDPYKTLFVARINYDTSESKLRREFDVYGPVKKVHMIMNRVTGKPRGYAFIEFEHERDMHAAYKHADGKKIDGRRILVDVERGRTVKGWRPRRLGGGLGNTRKGGADENTKYSGRDDFVGRDRAVPDDRKSLDVHSARDERPARSPDRFRRSTRSRERSRERRRNRSRSRDRRRRSRERRRSPEREIKKEPVDESEMPPSETDDGARKRRRTRSRERRRSRSRDRKRSRRSRSKERRGSKTRERNRGGEKDGGEAGAGAPTMESNGVFIKQEIDDSNDYGGAYDPAKPGDQYQGYNHESTDYGT